MQPANITQNIFLSFSSYHIFTQALDGYPVSTPWLHSTSYSTQFLPFNMLYIIEYRVQCIPLTAMIGTISRHCNDAL